MDKLKIIGGTPLIGKIRASGAKLSIAYFSGEPTHRRSAHAS